MRLSPEQIVAIRKGVLLVAGNAARVWLFGSRVRDQERGGDVDLLLELDEPVAEPVNSAPGLQRWFQEAFTAARSMC